MNFTADQLDKGADALRQYEMKGRVTLAWDRISSAQRFKWREKANAVLTAVEAPVHIHLQSNHTVEQVGNIMVVKS